MLMAEFCLDCFNKYNDEKLTENEVILSKDLDFCEDCCQYKRVVIRISNNSLLDRFLIWFNNKSR